MKLEVLDIPSDGQTLAGLRYLPEGKRREIALVFAHGFTSGKYSMDGIAGYLAGKGYEGVTFDYVGHKLGASGGEMRRALQAAENLRDALRWTRQHIEAERIALVGHSMGAAATLQVAAWEKDRSGTPPLVGIACLCIGLRPARHFETAIGKTMLTQRQDYVAGAPARQIIGEMETLVQSARAIGGLPALFVAARQDVLVPIAEVEELATLAAPDSTVAIIDSSHQEAPDRAKTAVLQWLEAR